VKEEKEEEKVPIEPKLSLKDKAKLKMEGVSGRYAEKYPSAHGKASHYFTVLSDVWQETFPNREKVVTGKMANRKERAKLAREWEERQAEMTPEELAAMEESIPEWKRNAMVVVSDDEEE